MKIPYKQFREQMKANKNIRQEVRTDLAIPYVLHS